MSARARRSTRARDERGSSDEGEDDVGCVRGVMDGRRREGRRVDDDGWIGGSGRIRDAKGRDEFGMGSSARAMNPIGDSSD